MVRDLFRGVTSIVRAIRLLIAHPRLRRLALRPFLVTVVLFAVGLPIAVWLAVGWADGLVSVESVMGTAARFVLEIAATVGAIVAATVLLLMLGSVVATPFNTRLSEEVERILAARSGRSVLQRRERGNVADLLGGIAIAAGRLLVFLAFYPPILLIQFVPVVGPFLYPTLTFLYAVFVLSLDLSEGVFDRNFSSFRANVAVVVAHKWLYLGFGGAMVVLMSIPVLDLLALPVGVTAATIIFEEDIRRFDNPARTRSITP